MRAFRRLVALASIVALLPTSGRSADIEPTVSKPNASGWTYAFSPYFWAAGLSGDVAQFGLPAVHVDPSFGDILENLDFGAMAVGEARNGRFSIFGDVIYTKLSIGAGTPRGIVAERVSVSSETFAGLAGVGYSIIGSGGSHFDLVAGVRLWDLDTDVSFKGGLLDGVKVSDGATWADGMVGFRARHALTESIYLTSWGLIGAGGADLDWDIAAAVGYRCNDRISVLAGYRALGVDYEKDDFVFDVVQEGPILGLVMNF